MKLRRLQIGELGRSVLKLGVGTAAGQGAVLLASPLWSRIYEPADFALLGLFLSFVSTVTVALALRYDLAIPLGMRNDDGARLLVLSLLLTVPLAVFGGAGMALMTWQDVLGFGALPMAAAPLAAFVLLVTGIFGALRYWHVGASDFGPISRSLVVQGVARATVPILLAPVHLGWFGLIAGEAVGRTLGIRRLIVSALPTLRRMLQQRSWLQLWECARSYRRFPAIFLPSALLDAVAAAAALPVFLTLHSLTAAGHFMLAQQVVAAPAALLCAALADVYHYKMTATARSEPAAVVPFLLNSALRISVLALIALVGIALLAPIAAGWIFGAQWREAGWMIAVLAPSTAMSIAPSSLSRAFVLSRIPQVKLIADVVKLVLPIIGIVVGLRVGGSPLASAIGYSVMYGLSYLLYFMIIVYSVRSSNQAAQI